MNERIDELMNGGRKEEGKKEGMQVWELKGRKEFTYHKMQEAIKTRGMKNET